MSRSYRLTRNHADDATDVPVVFKPFDDVAQD